MMDDDGFAHLFYFFFFGRSLLFDFHIGHGPWKTTNAESLSRDEIEILESRTSRRRKMDCTSTTVSDPGGR
jgi:hypothetical protein